MKIDVEVPVVLENIAPYGLNMGEGMRVALNADKTLFETIVRLCGNVFMVINPLRGSLIHVGGPNGDGTDDSDKALVVKTGEKLPPGTVIKFTL